VQGEIRISTGGIGLEPPTKAHARFHGIAELLVKRDDVIALAHLHVQLHATKIAQPLVQFGDERTGDSMPAEVRVCGQMSVAR